VKEGGVVAKYQIQTDDAKCSGCLRCQLACSEAYTKSFNPSAARINVDFVGADLGVRFTDDCVACGLCADNCFYGALRKISEGEA
jgi:Fe-S-cluster-containing dehydrogenase component